jgi:hypothetical protein
MSLLPELILCFLLKQLDITGSFGYKTWRPLMKRFIVSTLCIAVFFLGLGTLVEKVGARFKSDEKALELVRAARAAVGGDNAIAGIQSLRIKGTTTHSFKADGSERTENGETEIALQLPDKLSKMVKIGREDNDGTEQKIENRQQVIVVTKGDDGNATFKTTDGTEPGIKKVLVRKRDGSTDELKPGDGDKIIIRKGDGDLPLKTESGEVRTFKINKDEMETRHREAQQNELFRLTLGLFLSPPASMAVNYTFGGETTVDSTPCNLVVAELSGSSVKLYLDRNSNLPVMMSYSGEQMPMFVHFNKQVQAPAGGGDKDVVFFRSPEGPAATTEFQVRFSEYQSTGGIQLPYRWTTTAGDMREVFNVTSYEVNPANITDSFQQPKVVRVKKDGQ